MGVEGVALATIIAQGVFFICSVVYLNKKHKVLKAKFRGLKFDKDIFLSFSKDLICSFILTSAIKGAGDSMFALISSMISLWLVRIPCAYLFAELFGVNGIWMGIPSGWLIGGIITSIYYKKGSWKSKCVVSFDHVSLDAN